MYCCLICLYSLESSSDSSVAFKECGHVFHNECATKWLQTNQQQNPGKPNCPKCRREIENIETSLIRLYFGSSSSDDSEQELNHEINNFLEESEVAKNRIQLLMQEVNKNLNTIHQNTKEIAAKKRVMCNNENEFKLKNLAIFLSRTDELRRIQDYYDSLQ